MSDELCVYHGKAVQQGKSGLFSGMIAADLEKVEKLPIDWEGARIGVSLWEMIKSFMLWTYDEHTTEGQLRLYYNEDKGAWAAHPMPQYIHGGLFTEEIKNSPAADDINAKFNPMKWNYMGTVHHHCGAGAFQSGTDHKDEMTKTGLHITLGYVNRDVWDIDARCILRGLQYTVDMSQWLPEAEDAITKPSLGFPSHWKTCLVEKPKPKYTYVSGNKGKQIGFSGWKNDWFNSDSLDKMDSDYMSWEERHAQARDAFSSQDDGSGLTTDDELTDSMLFDEIEKNMYTSGDEVKRFVYDTMKSGFYQEDVLDDITYIYDAVERLINTEGFEPDFVINYAMYTIMDLLPEGYALMLDSDGALSFEINDKEAARRAKKLEKQRKKAEKEAKKAAKAKKKPRLTLKAPADGGDDGTVTERVTCIACAGTGHRSQDAMRGPCGICQGLRYVERRDHDEVLSGDSEVPF